MRHSTHLTKCKLAKAIIPEIPTQSWRWERGGVQKKGTRSHKITERACESGMWVSETGCCQMGLPREVQLRFDHRDEGGHSKQGGTAASSQVLCLSCSWDQCPSTCRGMLKHSLTQTFQDQKLWEIPQTTDKHCWKAQKAAWEEQLELERTASTTATWVWAIHKECGRIETLTPQAWHWPTRLPFLHRISN